MSQLKLLNDKQLKRLERMGFTKKELKSLATIKSKNFFVGQLLDTGMRTSEIKRVNEDGTIKNG